MSKCLWAAGSTRRQSAFTLVEVLVAMTVLVLLIGMIAQMTSGVSSVINRSQGRIDTDAQARALLDRMAIDIGAMVKRPDVDYYLKGRPDKLVQVGNDQIAFYSSVAGYFPPYSPDAQGQDAATPDPKTQSPVSLIAYRVNGTTLRLERLCKGLAWNGAGTNPDYTMNFLPVPLASPLPSPLPSPMPDTVPVPVWPQAADPVAVDLDYEQLAPQVFRFEYYYLLKGQSATALPPALSLTPWYVSAAGHTSVNGMQDVAGIGVVLAVIDPKSLTRISKAQLTALAEQMKDAPTPGTGSFTSAGDIETQWMTAINDTTVSNPIPRNVASSIRIYTRCFYLNGVSP